MTFSFDIPTGSTLLEVAVEDLKVRDVVFLGGTCLRRVMTAPVPAAADFRYDVTRLDTGEHVGTWQHPKGTVLLVLREV